MQGDATGAAREAMGATGATDPGRGWHIRLNAFPSGATRAMGATDLGRGWHVRLTAFTSGTSEGILGHRPSKGVPRKTKGPHFA